MNPALFEHTLGASLFAGLVAVGATRAIERWGSTLGGVLATLPTTIVPASIGIASQTLMDGRFPAAMAAIPFGMALNAGFLAIWATAPSWLPARVGGRRRLALLLGVSLSAWGLGAAGLAVALPYAAGHPIGLLAAAIAMNTLIAAGGWTVSAGVGRPTAAAQSVPAAALVGRGLLAAGAVATAVLLSAWASPTIAAMAAVFPAIFLTTMVSLWLSQGEAVPTRAAGPMMLGSASVGAYALLAGALFPAVGIGLGAPLAWLGAISLVTGPAAWLLGRRGAVAPRSAPAPGAPAPPRS